MREKKSKNIKIDQYSYDLLKKEGNLPLNIDLEITAKEVKKEDARKD